MDATDEELGLIENLRTALEENDKFSPERHTDVCLLRFLRGRNLDLSDAQEMLFKHEDWRKAQNVEKIIDEFVFPAHGEVNYNFPRYMHHLDRSGRPIYINHFGMFNLERVFEVSDMETLKKDVIVDMEILTRYILPACTVKAGKPVYQITMIMDLQDASVYQFNLYRQILTSIQEILVPNYPEVLSKLYMINAPYIFQSVWYVAKQLLDPKTLEKVDILGENYLEVLEKEIDLDHLPKVIKGNCECLDIPVEVYQKATEEALEKPNCIHNLKGVWNDGSTPGYPIPYWEEAKKRPAKK